MMINVAVVNAFIDGDEGGNPAGVVLDADRLSHGQKLEIAKQVGCSETAFVAHSDIADYKLDFYTPDRQIAHCGHATIAVFGLLASLGLIKNANSSKETIDGVRKIIVNANSAFMEQRKPEYQEVTEDLELILSSLSLSDTDLLAVPKVVNTGNSFLILGVKSITTLEKIVPDQQVIRLISEKLDLVGFYIFTEQTNMSARDASARMFAPRYGIPEESATGMAAGPLACYLHDIMGSYKDVFLIEQGYSMKPASPSIISVRMNKTNSQITELYAGGTSAVTRYTDINI